MAVQRNPIAGTSNPNDNNSDCLQRNGFRISTRSRRQIDTGLDWWAGETGGNQVIIYSTKNSQPEAYPSGSGDYTPVAWGSFNNLSDAKVLELINGLPGRPANTQYTTLDDAVSWLNTTEQYFMMNQDYPFIYIKTPAVLWDPSVPQCSSFGVGGNGNRLTQNLGNPDWISGNKTPSTFSPGNPSNQDFNSNGGTAYSTFQANTNHQGAVFHGNIDADLNYMYTGEGGWMATVWFRHNATAPYKVPLFCIGDPNNGSDGMMAYFDQTKLYVGNAGNFKTGNYAFATNTWYMVNVCFDKDNGEWRVYVNGSQLFDGGTSGYTMTNPQAIEIAGNRYFSGVLQAEVTLQVGFFMIDTIGTENRITYNKDAWTQPASINPRY